MKKIFFYSDIFVILLCLEYFQKSKKSNYLLIEKSLSLRYKIKSFSFKQRLFYNQTKN